jgi:hypothetical protein
MVHICVQVSGKHSKYTGVLFFSVAAVIEHIFSSVTSAVYLV